MIGGLLFVFFIGGHLMDAVVALAMVVAFVGVAGCPQAFVGLALFPRPEQTVAAVVNPFVGLGREELERSPLLGLECVLVGSRSKH